MSFEKKFNDYTVLSDGSVEIYLTQNQIGFCDYIDWINIKEFKWYAHYSHLTKTYYVQSCINRKTIHMHRMILNIDDKKSNANHKNFNTLDNRKSNLEECSGAQNCQYKRKRIDNTSGFKGVNWDKRIGKWCARIGVEGKRFFLGFFDDKIEAAKAYNEASKKYHGKFSILNDVG